MRASFGIGAEPALTALTAMECDCCDDHPRLTANGRLRLGMPQLSGLGLSETWLLEKCGDIHWSLICEWMGRPSQTLRDGAGNRVYPSFIALCVAGGLAGYGESDSLSYESALTRSSGTRFESRHLWSSGSQQLEVGMVSIFLRRRDRRGNHLERVEIPGAPAFGPLWRMSDLERSFRDQRARPAGTAPSLAEFVWQPALALDYNGAGLLYFARYHQLVERAEVAWFGETADSCYGLNRRETYYFANLSPGEAVRVGFQKAFDADGIRRHEAEIRCAGDGRLMARVLTSKARREFPAH